VQDLKEALKGRGRKRAKMAQRIGEETSCFTLCVEENLAEAMSTHRPP
jgi:hypothetical protein